MRLVFFGLRQWSGNPLSICYCSPPQPRLESNFQAKSDRNINRDGLELAQLHDASPILVLVFIIKSLKYLFQASKPAKIALFAAIFLLFA